MQVYYWCEATDEVLWEPPPGATPRTDAERDTAAAEAAALPAAEALPVDEVAASLPEPAAGGPRTAATAGARGAEASEASPAPKSNSDGSVSAEPPQAQQVAEQLSARLRQAAGAVFAGASKLVWLAVEAEVRARDLAALGAAHGPGPGHAPAAGRATAEPDAVAGPGARPTHTLLTPGMARAGPGAWRRPAAARHCSACCATCQGLVPITCPQDYDPRLPYFMVNPIVTFQQQLS